MPAIWECGSGPVVSLGAPTIEVVCNFGVWTCKDCESRPVVPQDALNVSAMACLVFARSIYNCLHADFTLLSLGLLRRCVDEHNLSHV